MTETPYFRTTAVTGFFGVLPDRSTAILGSRFPSPDAMSDNRYYVKLPTPAGLAKYLAQVGFEALQGFQALGRGLDHLGLPLKYLPAVFLD